MEIQLTLTQINIERNQAQLLGLKERCLSQIVGSLTAENDSKQQGREATNSGCGSHIGFKKCAPVDCVRIFVAGGKNCRFRR